MGKRKFFRLPFGLIGAGLFTVMITTALVWIGVVDDPFGGEPIAVIPLEKTVEGLSSRDIAVVELKPEFADGPLGPDASRSARQGALGPRFEGAEAQGEAGSGEGPGVALSTTPDSRVTERTDYGLLPKIGDNGLRPLDVYAKRVTAELGSTPKIAIVIGGIGLSEAGSRNALDSLPADVTLALAPYGNEIEGWMQEARQAGHELLLQLPLEPFDFPDNDPGPHTLLVSLRGAEFMDRLTWLLSRTTNYVGVVNFMGARFSSTEASMQYLLEEVTRRGLMYVDDGSSSRSVAQPVASAAQTPFSKVDVVLDAVPKPDEINARLLQLEALARARGIAVAAGSALPVTVRQLADWSRDLEQRGLMLVPISATVDRPQG
ncbi:Divergent polysaccharide deacetylase family [Polymorphum gilvum SL003B-26A1]|uniref:Divergent polysaccharide deacetylase family n=2 Tax=Polymorphum TaxID=991903 RepID=F2J6U0_POLGS|nr:Divergent polysaccharide deacetylase family [Polymorphum gilvum SL003B-26A1]